MAIVKDSKFKYDFDNLDKNQIGSKGIEVLIKIKYLQLTDLVISIGSFNEHPM